RKRIIGMNHRITSLPILVIFPHNRCNCRCVLCDIWRIRQVREITPRDLEPHLTSLRELNVKWIVFSGGEPLMHSDISSLSHVCRAEGVRVTLLTAGLTLEKRADIVAASIDDLIVSIDGPPDIHDKIRGVPGAYRRLQRGIEALISEYENEIESGFVVENAEKLRRIPLRFRSRLGQIPAMAPRCNAPWVSAVVESDGTVRPCFFHRPIGNIHEHPLADVVNSDEALNFRRNLDISRDPVCRNCVCSLFVNT